MTAVVTNDAVAEINIIAQTFLRMTAVATNDAVGISRSTYIKSYLQSSQVRI
jgi:hypothetical protein